MENNLSAARASRRHLEERLRNDWEYPDVPAVWSASDEEVRDAAGKKMQEDPRMKEMENMPFDGKRMIFGGFEVLLDTRA